MKDINFYVMTLVLLLLSALLADVPAMAQQLKGNGNVVTQDRKVPAFTGIDIGGGFAVEVTQGNNEGVKLEAEENLIENITTEVRNGILYIHTKGSMTTSKGFKAYVTVKELNSVEASGGVKIIGKSTFRTNTMTIDLSGASKITMAMDVKKLHAEASGACRAELTGQADVVTLDLSGASRVDAEALEAKRVQVEASSASRVSVFAKEALVIDASSAATVAYKGSPTVTAETSSAAKVSRL